MIQNGEGQRFSWLPSAEAADELHRCTEECTHHRLVSPFAPKAKRVIYLFQSGAPSQMDLFDDKSTLQLNIYNFTNTFYYAQYFGANAVPGPGR